MDAGSLDTPLVLLRQDLTRSDSGEAVKEPVEIATVWGAVRPVRGTEAFASKERFAEVEVRFEVWYRSDFDPIHLIRVPSGRVYTVVEVLALPGGRPERLEILARARAEGGAK